MTSSSRAIRLAVAALALALADSAGAQENLDQGKTGAQLYAADCAICHKSPRGMAGTGGIFGIQSFLRQHYTVSRESAAAIAAYLEAVDREAPPPAARSRAKRNPKAEKKPAGKPGDSKPGGVNATEPKPGETRSGETKPLEPKASEANALAEKPAQAKPAEPKTGEAKSAQTAKPDKTD